VIVIFCLLEDKPHAWRWELRRRQDEAVLARSTTEFGSIDEARQAVVRVQSGIGSAPVEKDGLEALK
jgi:hypothetical protein